MLVSYNLIIFLRSSAITIDILSFFTTQIALLCFQFRGNKLSLGSSVNYLLSVSVKQVQAHQVTPGSNNNRNNNLPQNDMQSSCHYSAAIYTIYTVYIKWNCLNCWAINQERGETTTTTTTTIATKQNFALDFTCSLRQWLSLVTVCPLAPSPSTDDNSIAALVARHFTSIEKERERCEEGGGRGLGGRGQRKREVNEMKWNLVSQHVTSLILWSMGSLERAAWRDRKILWFFTYELCAVFTEIVFFRIYIFGTLLFLWFNLRHKVDRRVCPLKG